MSTQTSTTQTAQEIVPFAQLPPIMAQFNRKRDCSDLVQAEVGLLAPNVTPPRTGDRSSNGSFGPETMGSRCHQQGMAKEVALAAYNQYTEAQRATPPSVLDAAAMIILAETAGQPAPPAAVTMAAGHFETAPAAVTYYNVPGGPLFQGQNDGFKFIAFIYVNTADETRVAWADMTGREQYEWYEAWVACERTHLSRPAQTLGLQGTNLAAIQTQGELTIAASVSPSLRDRWPAGHTLANPVWPRIRRRLFHG